MTEPNGSASAVTENVQSLGKILGRLTTPKPLQANSERIAAEQEREQKERIANRNENWARVVGKIGKRYADCRLENFTVDHSIKPQLNALEAITAFASNIGPNIEQGRNVVLWGPCGTGKDHLAIALLHAAAGAFKTVDWISGLLLFGAIRDNFDSETSERELFRMWLAPDVLLISDPSPPVGALTQFQATALFRIIDDRYRAMKSTFVTINAKSGDQAEEKTCPQVVDRLRDGALTIHCNWPSYRTPIGK